MSQIHTFPVSVHWPAVGTGATIIDGGATEYSRDGVASTVGKPAIPTSAAPAYNGNGDRWNPEDMFAAALGTCHMLTFFALARKAGIDIRSYHDDAVATLEMVDKAMRISKMKLAPQITVAVAADGSKDESKVRDLFEKAHKYCFVANSVTTKVEMAPTVVFV
jgi:organic hydroperoxide reductase OsmC/OhrA